MMRILWADDQPGVSNALAKLVGEARVDHVSDGEAAFARLSQDPYDLAILDLQMPPGEWGGLWLLDRLQHVEHCPPILVLSGAGSQRETIEALRLGARDYVAKESATRELPERVHLMLERSRTERAVSHEHATPSPIAVSYRLMRVATTKPEALRYGLTTVENALRFITLVNLKSSSLPLDLDQLEKMRSPSMGAWREMAQTSAKSPGALIMPEVSWSKVGKLVALRNDLAHGSAPMSPALAERHAEEVQQLLDELLTSVRRAGRLACVRSLDFDGSTLAIRGDALQGSGKWSEQIALPTTSPARTGAVVFAGPERLVDLSHWIECRSDGADGTPELLVFDGVQARRGRSLDGTESIRYAEVFSGARDRSIDSATSALLLSER